MIQITYHKDDNSKPIYFKLRPNTKKPIDCFKSVMTTKKDINPTLHNIGFRTGEVSNTTVIDLDLYHKGNTIPFMKYFGDTFINDFNTLTQSTPRGGLHLIFQYDITSNRLRWY